MGYTDSEVLDSTSALSSSFSPDFGVWFASAAFSRALDPKKFLHSEQRHRSEQTVFAWKHSQYL